MDRNSLGTKIARVHDAHRHLVDRSTAASLPTVPAADGTFVLPPPPPLPPMSLDAALRDRRSHYQFADIGALQLSALLRYAAGPSRTVDGPDSSPHTFRMNPTAGGLDSIDVHLVVPRPVGGIDSGTYLFDTSQHVLSRTACGPCVDALGSCLVQPEFARRASVVVVLAGRLDRTLVKYSERHYRTLHVDAGIATQNLYLVATALELGCCAISGFYDENISQLLGLDRNSIPLVAFAIGGRGEFGKQR
jgi:SagB-type dehydrogenase family enzyme